MKAPLGRRRALPSAGLPRASRKTDSSSHAGLGSPHARAPSLTSSSSSSLLSGGTDALEHHAVLGALHPDLLVQDPEKAPGVLGTSSGWQAHLEGDPGHTAEPRPPDRGQAWASRATEGIGGLWPGITTQTCWSGPTLPLTPRLSVEKPQNYHSLGYKGLDPASVFTSWMTLGNLLPLSEPHLSFRKMETDNTVLQGEDLTRASPLYTSHL